MKFILEIILTKRADFLRKKNIIRENKILQYIWYIIARYTFNISDKFLFLFFYLIFTKAWDSFGSYIYVYTQQSHVTPAALFTAALCYRESKRENANTMTAFQLASNSIMATCRGQSAAAAKFFTPIRHWFYLYEWICVMEDAIIGLSLTLIVALYKKLPRKQIGVCVTIQLHI